MVICKDDNPCLDCHKCYTTRNAILMGVLLIALLMWVACQIR
jgi:hypothetical protein